MWEICQQKQHLWAAIAKNNLLSDSGSENSKTWTPQLLLSCALPWYLVSHQSSVEAFKQLTCTNCCDELTDNLGTFWEHNHDQCCRCCWSCSFLYYCFHYALVFKTNSVLEKVNNPYSKYHISDISSSWILIELYFPFHSQVCWQIQKSNYRIVSSASTVIPMRLFLRPIPDRSNHIGSLWMWNCTTLISITAWLLQFQG